MSVILFFSNHRAVMVIKWSKTFQDRVKTTTLYIPFLGCSALCPVTPLSAMLTTLPTNVDSPLFQVPHGQAFKPLTDSAARKHLKSVSAWLGLSRFLTFHDFCRGGASWAFRRAVPVQDIQAQQTQTSNCVWRHITLPHSHSSQVSHAFRSHLYA